MAFLITLFIKNINEYLPNRKIIGQYTKKGEIKFSHTGQIYNI